MRFLPTLIAGYFLFTCLFAADFLLLGKGKALSVINARAVAELINQGAAGDSLEFYDRTTGIILGDVSEAKEHEIGQLSDYPICVNLYDQEKKVTAVILGVERQKGDKVLPFSYLRVHKSDESLDSGTLLFDEEGKALAFYYVDHDEQKNQGYVVPVAAVERAYADYKKNVTISRAWAGLIISSTGTVPEVISVRPDSPASKAGIKSGDILTQVGARKISSYLEAVNAFYYLIPTVEEQFVMIRDGQKKTFAVTPISRDSL